MKVKKNNSEILNLFNTNTGKSEQQVKLNNRDFNTDVEGRRGVRYNLGAAAQLNPILLGDTSKPVILCWNMGWELVKNVHFSCLAKHFQE